MKEKDKKEDKSRRLSIVIENMEIGESINPTNLAKKINIHPNTLRDILDQFDFLKEIGFETIRDKNRKIKEIIRTNNSHNFLKEVRELKKIIIDLQTKVEELTQKKYGK